MPRVFQRQEVRPQEQPFVGFLVGLLGSVDQNVIPAVAGRMGAVFVDAFQIRRELFYGSHGQNTRGLSEAVGACILDRIGQSLEEGQDVICNQQYNGKRRRIETIYDVASQTGAVAVGLQMHMALPDVAGRLQGWIDNGAIPGGSDSVWGDGGFPAHSKKVSRQPSFITLEEELDNGTPHVTVLKVDVDPTQPCASVVEQVINGLDEHAIQPAVRV